MNIWLLIVVLGLWSYLLRVAGPLIVNKTTLPHSAITVLNNVTPAVLSALIVAGMFSSARTLVLDERAFGFAAAVLAVIGKLPPLAVIVAAAAATAAARALL